MSDETTGFVRPGRAATIYALPPAISGGVVTTYVGHSPNGSPALSTHSWRIARTQFDATSGASIGGVQWSGAAYDKRLDQAEGIAYS